MSKAQAIIAILYLAYTIIDLEYIYEAKSLVKFYKNFKQGIIIFTVGIMGMFMNCIFINSSIPFVIGFFANLIYWFIADMLVIKAQATNN